MSFLKIKPMHFVLCFLGLGFCFVAYSQGQSDERGEYVRSVVLWYEHELFESESSQYVSWRESKLKDPVCIVKSLQRYFLENAVRERSASVNRSDVQEVALNFMSYNLQIVCKNNGRIFVYAYPAGLYTKRQLASFLNVEIYLQCDHYWYAEYDSKSDKILSACIHIADMQEKLGVDSGCGLPLDALQKSELK